jgi:glycosyltransferase involved in cell wall biosynthesis
MKLLFLITEDWYFWSHRLPIAQAAQNSGFKVVVATRVGDHQKLIEREGFKLIPLKLRRKNNSFFYEIKSIFQIIKIYIQEDPDLVHQVALKPVFYGTLASFFCGHPKTVNALGGLGYIFVSNKLWMAALKNVIIAIFRILFRAADSVTIFQNPEDLNFFVNKRIIDTKSSVLIRGAGVDISYYNITSEPKQSNNVIVASRMLWNKGIGEFFKAAKQLKEQNVRCRMIVIGAPDHENPASIAEDTLWKWNSTGIIEYWGHKNDMQTILSNSNIVVLPTYYGEGLPKILLEAASCGRAIIATDVPGCREIVRHDENGILVPPRDPRALAKAIQYLIENPEIRKKMGQRGRDIVISEFSEEIVVNKTMKLYNTLKYQLKRKTDKYDHSRYRR